MNLFVIGWNLPKEHFPMILAQLGQMIEVYPQLDPKTLWHRNPRPGPEPRCFDARMLSSTMTRTPCRWARGKVWPEERRAGIRQETSSGSTNAERVLLFILAREEGYNREIARFFGCDPDSIQKQLAKFETGGVLVCRQAGKTHLYSFNPRYPFLKELKVLLEKALTFYSQDEQEQLLMNRRRPRRIGKPL